MHDLGINGSNLSSPTTAVISCMQTLHHLQNEEAIVVEVNALALEHLGDLREVAASVVDVVVRLVVALSCPGHREVCAGHGLKVLAWLQLSQSLVSTRGARLCYVALVIVIAPALAQETSLVLTQRLSERSARLLCHAGPAKEKRKQLQLYRFCSIWSGFGKTARSSKGY